MAVTIQESLDGLTGLLSLPVCACAGTRARRDWPLPKSRVQSHVIRNHDPSLWHVATTAVPIQREGS